MRESHSISSMFHRTLLDPQLSPHFSTPFSTFAPGLSTSLSLLYPSVCPSTATLQGGLCLGRLAEQSPLTGYEPKSLIEVISEHTPINLPSKQGSFDTNLDDLATTVDASEVYDTTDVGRLTSPLFSVEREVSANPFSVSCSQTDSSVERPMRDTDLFSSIGRLVRDVEPFSSFGRPLSKGERNRDFWSVQDFQMDKEILMTSLKSTLIMLFKENSQLRQNYLKRSLNWTNKNGECEMLLLLSAKMACKLQSQRMELCQVNQLTYQTRREKSWLCDELEMRNGAFQEDGARNCQNKRRIMKKLLHRG